jgi:dolichol kinase
VNLDTAARLGFFVIVAAIVFSLVRPNSKAATAVPLFTDTLAAVIGTATGYTQRGG